jgi:hypothetical protein
MNLFLIGEQTPDNGNFLFSGKGQETGSKHVDDDGVPSAAADHESDDLADPKWSYD